MCASEVAPFAKTGGLADVVASLPPELHALGHDVRIVMPLHGSIDRVKYDLKLVVPQMGVAIGHGEQWCAVQEGKLPSSEVPVYFLEHERYFGRQELYQSNGVDYSDNAERFAFFSRACLQLAKALNFSPDIVHCHDWQTALIPVYLKTWEADHHNLYASASVQSIHNLGYQGIFPKDEFFHTQLGWQRYTEDGLEFYDKVNYLKGGILFADKIATVSPTYAKEIQTPEHGWGMDGILRRRAGDLVGILNACDYREWNPSTDPFIPQKFDADDLAGKAACKKILQEKFNLPVKPDVPVIAMVSRLAYQKGIDVLASAMSRILELDIQFVVLGTGEVWAHFYFGDMPARYRGKVGSFIGFDNERAHQTYAGADFFLMPSRYEPCGLSQMMAMRYGTLPIVRSTGGLVDTVENYVEATGAGDGFRFDDLTPNAIFDTVGWAVSTYYDRKQHLKQLIDTAMAQRFSWESAAHKYVELYGWAIEKKRGAA